MRIPEAATKWGMSQGWVRTLVKRGIVPTTIKYEGKRAHYLIPAWALKPQLPQGRPSNALRKQRRKAKKVKVALLGKGGKGKKSVFVEMK